MSDTSQPTTERVGACDLRAGDTVRYKNRLQTVRGSVGTSAASWSLTLVDDAGREDFVIGHRDAQMTRLLVQP